MLTFTFERVVPFLNTICAAVALWANVKAVVLGPPAHRRLRAVIAALCAVYAVAYTLLWTGFILGASERSYWSQGMASVGLLSWPVVWVWQARQDVKQFQGALVAAGLKEEKDDARIGGEHWYLSTGRGPGGRGADRTQSDRSRPLQPASIRRAS